MNNSTPPLFYLSEPQLLPIMRRACHLYAFLLPPWQKPDEQCALFCATMLAAGSVGNIVFCLGRAFSAKMLPLLVEAEAFELVMGLENAIAHGRSLLDEAGSLDAEGLELDPAMQAARRADII
ncbi:hypothetical protein [Hymenobacter segetis]|uniref:Uncharacterized protein n=1 Tax=Hymenobacter segetis TaxID=2025509 RepID=A0ABU9LVA8_9BACT